MSDSVLKPLFWLVLLALLAAIGWQFRELLLPPEPPPIVAKPANSDDTAIEPEGPLHPISGAQGGSTPRTLVALPALDDSNGFFLLEVRAIFGADVESLLLREAIIDRLVATIDNLPRDRVSDKIRPVGRLTHSFAVTHAADEQMVLGEESFRRYDALVRHISLVDLDAMVDMYGRYYPLFQESYERLGYPNAYFNDRFVEVIDHLLATPNPDVPPVLVRPNVLYEFADPELEQLSSGQKLLLRMGAANATIVKQRLRALRDKIAST